MVKKIVLLIALMYLVMVKVSFAKSAPWVGLAFSGGLCQGGNIPYGPYDYTNSQHKSHDLPIVDEYHFSKDVEMLKEGGNLAGGPGYSIPGSIDYTLLAFPNHHRALNALINYQLIYKRDIENKTKQNIYSPVECYLQRAIYFSPQDVVSHMIYASYLKKTKHFQEAEPIYKKALRLAPDEPAIKHSYGLFLFGLKRYPEALEQARIIYGKNYPKQKLKELLVKSGHWQK